MSKATIKRDESGHRLKKAMIVPAEAPRHRLMPFSGAWLFHDMMPKGASITSRACARLLLVIILYESKMKKRNGLLAGPRGSSNIETTVF